MHWDVIEVKPEPDYCLFVRFQDGLSGLVRLRPEHLAGNLAPLRDPDFFQRVYVDRAPSPWPGKIDLAPAAMYDEVASHPALQAP
jgi:hypothetical protein